ncbi:MAG TPA: PspC domain-containing protein [Herpetosiphonaceae bacterium]|jgi:phage shock protein C|nr:PspC domain-containing protein [Herpetosiphonaceae bacterium]
MQTRQLRRSRTNRRIAGVCGGLGEQFGIDPTLIRILFVLLGLPGGAPGVLLYMILWLVMPEE